MHIDGPDDDKVRCRRARQFMALERSAEIAAVGNTGAVSFSCANNSRNAIIIRKKFDADVSADGKVKCGHAGGVAGDSFKERLVQRHCW